LPSRLLPDPFHFQVSLAPALRLFRPRSDSPASLLLPALSQRGAAAPSPFLLSHPPQNVPCPFCWMRGFRNAGFGFPLVACKRPGPCDSSGPYPDFPSPSILLHDVELPINGAVPEILKEVHFPVPPSLLPWCSMPPPGVQGRVGEIRPHPTSIPSLPYRHLISLVKTSSLPPDARPRSLTFVSPGCSPPFPPDSALRYAEPAHLAV